MSPIDGLVRAHPSGPGDMLPPEGVLRRIAELENAIAAVEAVAGEKTDRAR